MECREQKHSNDDSSLPSSTESADTTDTLLEKPLARYHENTLPFWREHIKTVLATAPANEALKWNVVEWEHDDGAHGDYVGEPRPVLERAWRDIFDSGFSRPSIEPEE
ncbi:hypothetical protein RJZ90_000623 [Blastomyces dermatitidis]